MTESATPPIAVRGARVHNLKGIDLDLPRGALIALCGVSGSGKSSLALDTLGVEGQRRLWEALGDRGAGPALARPDVDWLGGLPPTLVVPSRAPAASARSCVATRADLHDLLRALYAHRGVARCPGCGRALPVHSALSATADLARLPEGTRLTLLAPVVRQRVGGIRDLVDEMARQGFARMRVDGVIHRLDEAPAVDARAPHTVELVVDRVRVAPDRTERLLEALQTAWLSGKGQALVQVQPEAGPDEERSYADRPTCPTCATTLPLPTPALFSFNTGAGACPACDGLGVQGEAPCARCAGGRLGPEASAFHLGDRSLDALLRAPVSEVAAWVAALPVDAATAPVCAELGTRLALLARLGLGHLPLGRGLPALSAGEGRRLQLAARAAGELTGVLFIVDEPTSGLSAEDADAVRAVLLDRVAKGDTVLAVTHDPALVRAAARVVEFGPGAGADGGQVLYDGGHDGLALADTATGRWMAGRLPSPDQRGRRGQGALRLRGARGQNLHLDLDLPLRSLVVISGPSGSGKSALLEGTLGRALAGQVHDAGAAPLPFTALTGGEAITRVVRLHQAPLGRAARATLATTAGLWGPIRRQLAETREARALGLTAEAFSFNRPGGRCESCEGTGVRAVRLALLPETTTPCEVCEGRRFGPSVLGVRYRGANAAELLQLTVSEARRLYAAPALEAAMRALELAGLGYLRLGQSTDTLSGGEAQRVRLARELARPGGAADTLFLLDAPAMGLHATDVDRVIAALQGLVDQGASVICADTDPRVIAAADHLVRLGPGAGPAGGRLVYAGPP